MEKSFEASFAGCSCNEIYIRVSNEVNELKNVRLCVINSENKLTELTCDYEKKDSLLFHFPITQLEKIAIKSVVFCFHFQDSLSLLLFLSLRYLSRFQFL